MEGCCHGNLDEIYATLLSAEEKEHVKIDLLICCGDFQVCYTPLFEKDGSFKTLVAFAGSPKLR